MAEFVINAEELADKVILNRQEYQALKASRGSRESYESLSAALSIRNDQIQSLQEALEKEQIEVARLRRVLRHHGVPETDVDYEAYNYPEIARGITVEEFLEAVQWAQEYGLTNLDKRTLSVWNQYKK